MTHRVHPYIFRIGQTTVWKSRWFNSKRFVQYLREDTLLREFLERRLKASHIERVEIERSPASIQVIVKTARPGILIGRGGEGAARLKQEIELFIARITRRWSSAAGRREVRFPVGEKSAGANPRAIEKSVGSYPRTFEKSAGVKLTIEEVRFPETHAAIAAQMIADDLEKRLPFRRTLRQALDKIAASKEVKGVKVSLKGRLDGAEMARYEWGKRGRIPLQTIRADVDYAGKTAYTTYGTIGVKVWIFKGEVFDSAELKK